jgi:hypothetical protein
MTDALAASTVFFALVLALALLIERFLEILKAVYDVVDSRMNWYHFWTRRAAVLQNRLAKRMAVFEYLDPDAVKAVLNRVYEMLLNTQPGYSGVVPVISGDLVRAAGVRVGCKLVGMALGVGLALWLGLDLITLWENPPVPNPERLLLPPTARIILTGLALGLGPGPVHKIITTIERKQSEQAKKGPAS